MSNEKHPIDELFNSKLHDYSVDAPEHVWKNIEATRTPLYRAMNFLKSRRAIMAGSFVLLVGIASAVYLYPGKNTGAITLTHKAAIEKAVQQNTPGTQTVVAPVNSNTPATGTETIATPHITYTNPTPTIVRNTSANGGNNNNGSSNNNTVTSSNTVTPNTSTYNTSDNNSNTTVNPSEPVTGSGENNNSANDGNAIITSAQGGTAIVTETDPSATNTETEGITETEKAASQAIKPEDIHNCAFKLASADAYTSLDFAGRSLKENGVSTQYFNAVKNSEKFTPGYSAGLRLNFNLNKANTFKLRAGLQYTRMNQQLNYTGQKTYTTTKIGYALDDKGQPDYSKPIPVTVTDTRTINVSHNNAFSFVDVPITLEWTAVRCSNFSFFATTGAAYNLRFTQRGMQLNSNLDGANEIRATNSYRTTSGLSLLGGVGMEYKFRQDGNWSLLAEGVYRHGLSNMYSSQAGMTQNYRIISGTVGLRYKF